MIYKIHSFLALDLEIVLIPVSISLARDRSCMNR